MSSMYSARVKPQLCIMKAPRDTESQSEIASSAVEKSITAFLARNDEPKEFYVSSWFWVPIRLKKLHHILTILSELFLGCSIFFVPSLLLHKPQHNNVLLSYVFVGCSACCSAPMSEVSQNWSQFPKIHFRKKKFPACEVKRRDIVPNKTR